MVERSLKFVLKGNATGGVFNRLVLMIESGFDLL